MYFLAHKYKISLLPEWLGEIHYLVVSFLTLKKKKKNEKGQSVSA